MVLSRIRAVLRGTGDHLVSDRRLWRIFLRVSRRLEPVKKRPSRNLLPLALCVPALCWAIDTLAATAKAQSAEIARAGSIDPERVQPASRASIQHGLGGSIRVDVNLVLVPVSVTDLLNRPVIDLQREDFALFQDEVPQRVDYFSTEDSPVSVGLLLDVSKSMTNKFEMERAAVAEFFKNANKQDDLFCDRVFRSPETDHLRYAID